MYIEIGIVKKERVKNEYFKWMIFFLHFCFLYDVCLFVDLFFVSGGKIILREAKQLCH